MIEKFISLKNIGKFVTVFPKGDVSLRKLTLLYGENGRGKTTICAIFRSLRSNESSLIDERKTFGSRDDTACNIRISGQNYKFTNGTWENTYPNISIYDSDFIHKNVYTGDVVDHQHKKNLFQVIVGEKGVEHNKKINVLNKQARDITAGIKLKTKEVEKYIPEKLSIEAFISLVEIENIDDKITILDNELGKIQTQIKESSLITTKKEFLSLTLPILPETFSNILNKSLEEIDETAGEKVNEHISNCMLSPNELWLSQGTGLAKNDSCPFCGQNTENNSLITAYRTYFNQEYKQLKQDIKDLQGQLETAIGEHTMFPLQKKLSENFLLSEFWKTHIDQQKLPVIIFEDIQRTYSELLTVCLTLTKQKQATPLEVINKNDKFETTISSIIDLKGKVNGYNVAIKTFNEEIVNFKKKLATDNDVKLVKEKLDRIKTIKKRFEASTIKAIEEYEAAKISKTKIDQEKKVGKEALNTYCTNVLSKYEKSINLYLSNFNTGFSVVKTKPSYLGGSPSSQYQLLINKTPVGLEKFKTTMSSGDKNSLAFAFFLASLDHDSDLSNKIVALDDPFTSLDRFRRECTAQLCQKLCSKTKQVIVLSHDPHFLKMVYDKHNSSEVKTLQLPKLASGSVIGEWDIETELQSSYMKNYSILLAYFRDSAGEKTDVARSIRPFLEGLLRTHFPGHFTENEWLGDFIKKIRESSEDSGLSHAKSDLEEIESINEFSKKFHHDQNPNANSEIINEDELFGFTKRTLALVGGI